MTARDYGAISRQLLAGDHGLDALVRQLRRRCPDLVRQLESDRGRRAMLRLWGDCVNMDENTRSIIVPLPILAALSALTNVPLQHPIVHAGVTHTYGYLFSQIETPYGRKRDRWVEGQIAGVLGVPPHTLSAQPRQGTLLANATYLLGRIAFRGRPRQQRRLRALRPQVAEAIRDYPYARVRGERIVETIKGPRRTVRIYTDLVDSPGTRTERALLIYWWSDQGGEAKLMTAFPITPAVRAELLAPARFASDVELALRFNGFIAPLGKAKEIRLRGTRELYARTSRWTRLA